MITVGYGDITPQTTIERIFCLMTMIVASGVFSFTMNRIGNVLADFDKSSQFYQYRIEPIDRFLNRRNVDKPMQIRIKNYLKYIWDANNIDKD